jgi:hypothetical protein
MRGRPPAAPDETATFQLVFSANPQRMASLGWDAAKMLGPDSALH